MNGYYPRGEAEPGTYLKIIAKQEKAEAGEEGEDKEQK